MLNIQINMTLWLNGFIRRLICLYQGCDARTGAHEKCSKCPAYHTDITNCDIPNASTTT